MIHIYQNNVPFIIVISAITFISLFSTEYREFFWISLLWHFYALLIVGYCIKKLYSRKEPIATISADGIFIKKHGLISWSAIELLFITEETEVRDGYIGIVLKQEPIPRTVLSKYCMKFTRWFYGTHIRLINVRDAEKVFAIINDYKSIARDTNPHI